MRHAWPLAGAWVLASASAGLGATLRDKVLDGPMRDVKEIVFACRQVGADGHWYANFGYYAPDENRKMYRAMGRLCKLDLRTGRTTTLLDDPTGTIRDPQIHYDGVKILFSYRKGGSTFFHLYEINADGTGLRQLTDGPYDDIEPTYLPDGGIVFCSSRCNRWVNCWLTAVAILYRCDGDGNRIHPISGNIEHDNTPWVLPDGRILYQRWEYIDRSQVNYHHLWTANPDGTGQMIYYGNLHPGIVMIDAKPIPRTDKVVAVFSPRHGRKEHAGAITIVTPKAGPDDKASARRVSKADDYRDPYPFSEDCFLVARHDRLQVMDGRGRTVDIYRLPPALAKAGVQCHEPRPICLRPRERVIAPRVNLEQTTGRLVLTDVYDGRRMTGVRRGEITRLLVLEALPKPINFTGGMEPLSYGGTFTLERILGTVPVEPDGSAYMEVPALRSLFFVALDEQNNSVKRMQSFLVVMPGETTSCVGCHEQRTRTPVNRARPTLAALKRPPSRIAKLEGIPDVFDFPRDVQPILDKHCVTCHGADRRKGGVLLTGDRGPMFSHSYYMLTVRRQVADGRNLARSNYAPRALGSSASPLMKKIDGSHHDVKVSGRDRDMIRYWIETGAAYPGTYAALGSGMIGGYAQNRLDRSDTQWPEMKAGMGVLKRRCATCHTGKRQLPTTPTDDMGMPPWRVHYGNPKLRFSRHIVYNLSRPEKSVLLLAPLSKGAGGYGVCGAQARRGAATAPASAVFAATSDSDYQTLLTAIRRAKRKLHEIRRFDIPGFRPRRGYVRELKRYGILPPDLAQDAAIDVYAADRAYWRSLWWRPISRRDPIP